MFKWLFVCILIASINKNEGLNLTVSEKAESYVVGSNLTISCTDDTQNDLDWLKDGQHITSCKLDVDQCLPSNVKYTLDQSKRQFSLSINSLNFTDCGMYSCKTRTDNKYHTIKIVDYIHGIELQETDEGVTVATDCTIQAACVDIRWFYIYQDWEPRAYGSSATQTEVADSCSGKCGEQNKQRISSSLLFPTKTKNSLPVKIMAYVRQADNVFTKTSVKEYFIEGCAPSDSKNIVAAIALALFCILLQVIVALIQKYRKDKPCSEIVDVFLSKILVMLILLIICITLLSEKEPRVPDVLGKCHYIYKRSDIITGVSYILITLCFILDAICRLIDWKDSRLTSCLECRQNRTTGDMDPANESFLPNPGSPEYVKGFINKEMEKEKYISLPCVPCCCDAIKVEIGGTAILKCHALDIRSPTWKDNKGVNIEIDGEKISWDDDQKSIRIMNVQVEDAGTYTCLPTDGEKVYIVKLFIILSTKDVDVDLGDDVVLETGEGMTRPYPLWGRWNLMNVELHEKLLVESNIHWHTDNSGLVIKAVQEKDHGMYEVCSKNLIKRFNVNNKSRSLIAATTEVYKGQNVRLDCSNEIDKGKYPAWECQESGFYNKARKREFYNATGRFQWYYDAQNLLIKDIQPEDSGTYECKHSDGTKEFVKVNVISRQT